MDKKFWYVLWGALYILCAGLGFLGEANGFITALLILLALGCFIPPAALLYRGIQSGDRKLICRIRNLSALSLGGTLALMVLNLLCAAGSTQAMGDLLFGLLVLVSSPMYCMRNGFVSLFLWACLLMVGIRHTKKKK